MRTWRRGALLLPGVAGHLRLMWLLRRSAADRIDLAPGQRVDAAGARIRTYAYWPGIDQPHSMRSWEIGQNGATYYYSLDLPTNNVQGLFGTGGSVAARYDYSPFGEGYTSTGYVQGDSLDYSIPLWGLGRRAYDATRACLENESEDR